MSEVMIVDPELLTRAPKAFRDYVEKYFVEKKVLGKACLVAARSSWGSDHGKGNAPSHSLDLRRWKDGLPSGQELGEWIREQERTGDGIWSLYGVDPPAAFDDD